MIQYKNTMDSNTAPREMHLLLMKENLQLDSRQTPGCKLLSTFIITHYHWSVVVVSCYSDGTTYPASLYMSIIKKISLPKLLNNAVPCPWTGRKSNSKILYILVYHIAHRSPLCTLFFSPISVFHCFFWEQEWTSQTLCFSPDKDYHPSITQVQMLHSNAVLPESCHEDNIHQYHNHVQSTINTVFSSHRHAPHLPQTASSHHVHIGSF